MFLAGRGAGKTRSGAEWIRANVKLGIKRIGLIAPTAADSRDVMVEGSSGILEVCWEYDRDVKGVPLGKPLYEPSKRRLTWANGAMATTFSAEEPERLRGPQHELLWCDELAAWQYAQDCWDMAMFGLRIGVHPRAMVTTTPKPIPVVRELMRSPNCVVTRATTYANLPNLAPSFVNALMQRYEGTRIGRQELMGEVVEEAEGALWNRDMIAAAQWPVGKQLPPPQPWQVWMFVAGRGAGKTRSGAEWIREFPYEASDADIACAHHRAPLPNPRCRAETFDLVRRRNIDADFQLLLLLPFGPARAFLLHPSQGSMLAAYRHRAGCKPRPRRRSETSASRYRALHATPPRPTENDPCPRDDQREESNDAPAYRCCRRVRTCARSLPPASHLLTAASPHRPQPDRATFRGILSTSALVVSVLQPHADEALR
jgi:hypothetical protein